MPNESDASSLVRPFEWLTSPASLRPILQDVLAAMSRNRGRAECHVLHVGSGSSVLGEYMLDHSKEISSTVSISKVVNVDKDEATLELMESRWKLRHRNNTAMQQKLEFCNVDLVQERIPYPDHSFDVVVDKSTLDCALCSDRAAAWLLHEVYRLLRPNGGTYVLISFHHLDLLLPLLGQCPGMKWTVSHSVMRREVEDLISKNGNQTHKESLLSSSPVQSEPLLEGSENSIVQDRRMVNVLIARRDSLTANELDELDFEAIYHHIHRTNDNWYKNTASILTPDRLTEIRQAFDKEGCSGEQNEGSLSLARCYEILFTDAEREHLTFEFFLEDWNAFCKEHSNTTSSNGMTVDVALAFLEEMQ